MTHSHIEILVQNNTHAAVPYWAVCSDVRLRETKTKDIAIFFYFSKYNFVSGSTFLVTTRLSSW